MLRIFAPKREDVRGWRELHNDKLHNFSLQYMLLVQVKEDERSGACNTHGEMINAYKILVRKPDRDIEKIISK
jgi:hypothetical protein